MISMLRETFWLDMFVHKLAAIKRDILKMRKELEGMSCRVYGLYLKTITLMVDKIPTVVVHYVIFVHQ